MKAKLVLVLEIILFIAAIGYCIYFFLMPAIAMGGLRSAISSNDADKINSYIDFKSVAANAHADTHLLKVKIDKQPDGFEKNLNLFKIGLVDLLIINGVVPEKTLHTLKLIDATGIDLGKLHLCGPTDSNCFRMNVGEGIMDMTIYIVGDDQKSDWSVVFTRNLLTGFKITKVTGFTEYFLKE